MRMQKLVLGLPVAQILPEEINKIFLPKNLGFIDVLSTVRFNIFSLVMDLTCPIPKQKLSTHISRYFCSKLTSIRNGYKCINSNLLTIEKTNRTILQITKNARLKWHDFNILTLHCIVIVIYDHGAKIGFNFNHATAISLCFISC